MFKRFSTEVVCVLALIGSIPTMVRSAEAASASSDNIEIINVDSPSAAHTIAIPLFVGPPQGSVDLAQVINNDLARTGRFRTLPRSQIPTPSSTVESVNFDNWRQTGMDSLVVGQIHQNGDGTIGVRFTLLDIAKGVQLMAYDMPPVSLNQLRYVGHLIADLIYQRITGGTGAFTSKIAYVSASGLGSSRGFELIVADADGDSPRAVARSREPLMSPAWSPDRKQLTYVGFEHGSSAIYLQNLGTGQVRKLVAEKGVNGSPAWSPDGRSIAATLSLGANPDIYIIDVETGARRRLTDYAGVDAEPSWSPDGRSLVFTSDRSGQPQIYQIPVEGGDPKRLTFEGQQNLRARYSPDGKSLALVTYQDKVYRIAIVDLANKSSKIISSGPFDESPSFSPNGAILIYATIIHQQGVLTTVSVDGSVKILMNQQDHDLHEPAWSPLSH